MDSCRCKLPINPAKWNSGNTLAVLVTGWDGRVSVLLARVSK